MSRLHRSASARMSRPAISIQSGGGWSFGSPSVLMMFHRAPGDLESELAKMDECMPHYYKVTNNHGPVSYTHLHYSLLLITCDKKKGTTSVAPFFLELVAGLEPATC